MVGEMGPVNFQVKQLNGKRKPYTVHVERLKRYHVKDADLCSLNDDSTAAVEVNEVSGQCLQDPTVNEPAASDSVARAVEIESDHDNEPAVRPRRERKRPDRLINTV